MGFLSGIGNALNSLTGVSASARQANRYNTSLARMSYATEKEFAQNAHQWEMNDLQAAGLNPALTTGASSAGSVASAGGVGNSATSGTSGGSPFDIINMLNQTSAVKHDNILKDANTKFVKAQAKAIDAKIAKDKAETKFFNERARGFSYTNETSITRSRSENKGWETGAFSIKGGLKNGHSYSNSIHKKESYTK